MAATFTLARPTPNPDFKEGNRKRLVRDVTVSGTYTTGGDTLSASAFGLKVISEFIVHGQATDGTVSYPVSYIYSTASTGKVQLWESGGTAGTAAADKGSGESLTGITFRVTVIGY